MVTARSVSVQREALDATGQRSDGRPGVRDGRRGDLKRTQIVQYAGASGDYNPLHTDEIYATKIAGYPSVFAHGMLTMGLTGQAIAGLVGTENLLRFGVRFTAQVWPGDTLTVRTSVVRIAEDETARWPSSRCPR